MAIYTDLKLSDIKKDFKNKTTFIKFIKQTLTISNANKYFKRYPNNKQLDDFQKSFFNDNYNSGVPYIKSLISFEEFVSTLYFYNNEKITRQNIRNYIELIAEMGDKLKTLNANIIADNIIKLLKGNEKGNK